MWELVSTVRAIHLSCAVIANKTGLERTVLGLLKKYMAAQPLQPAFILITITISNAFHSTSMCCFSV